MVPFGERLRSIALRGVPVAEFNEAGVMSCGRLDFCVRTRGVGEGLRSTAGDLGGTAGGSSLSSCSWKLLVSTFKVGFGVAPGLRMGDSDLAVTRGVSEIGNWVVCWACTGEGPVTQAIIASPNGPALQLVPGALQDLSWPKASWESFRIGGLPGIVARGHLVTGIKVRTSL